MRPCTLRDRAQHGSYSSAVFRQRADLRPHFRRSRLPAGTLKPDVRLDLIRAIVREIRFQCSLSAMGSPEQTLCVRPAISCQREKVLFCLPNGRPRVCGHLFSFRYAGHPPSDRSASGHRRNYSPGSGHLRPLKVHVDEIGDPTEVPLSAESWPIAVKFRFCRICQRGSSTVPPADVLMSMSGSQP